MTNVWWRCYLEVVVGEDEAVEVVQRDEGVGGDGVKLKVKDRLHLRRSQQKKLQ